MTSKISFKIRDYSDEYSSVGMFIPAVDDTLWISTNTKVLALQAAIAAITEGAIASKTLVAYTETVDDERPVSKSAQVESGLRLYYKDTVTGKNSYMTIPAPDFTITRQAGTDQIDLSLSLVATMVAAIEALAVSDVGNPIEILEGWHIGRKGPTRRR